MIVSIFDTSYTNNFCGKLIVLFACEGKFLFLNKRKDYFVI
ncbi:hypothetical protein LPE509_00795 [Legionella pneumophila subsp. pneumophila LPE509]|nr:hypothetical protein LPE509_00795 [Legionella pneumophila subsp. pneumophila LPE509]